MKRAMTWVAIGLIILGVALGGVVAVGIFSGWQFSFNSFNQGMASLANRQTFPMADIENLDILYRSDSVTFEVTSGDELILEEYMSHPSEDKYAIVSQSSDTLRIEQGNRSDDWFMFYNVSYAVVYIPADWHGNFDAECSSGSLRTERDWQFNTVRLWVTSGSIRFEGIESAGDVLMNTSSGAVKAGAVVSGGDCTITATSGGVNVTSARATGKVTSTVGSGSLKFEAVDAPEIYMEAKSGAVKLGSVTGAFDLSTTSGSIHVDDGVGHGSAIASSGSVRVALSGVTGDMHLQTTSGSVKFDMPRDLSFTFEGETGSGSLKTAFDNALSFNDKGNQATGTVGDDEPEFHIFCKASSGSVKVEY